MLREDSELLPVNGGRGAESVSAEHTSHTSQDNTQLCLETFSFIGKQKHPFCPESQLKKRGGSAGGLPPSGLAICTFLLQHPLAQHLPLRIAFVRQLA
eukprot:scaffold48519_cov21-Tisochrysis_lutea.AAC.1